MGNMYMQSKTNRYEVLERWPYSIYKGVVPLGNIRAVTVVADRNYNLVTRL